MVLQFVNIVLHSKTRANKYNLLLKINDEINTIFYVWLHNYLKHWRGICQFKWAADWNKSVYLCLSVYLSKVSLAIRKSSTCWGDLNIS